MGKCNRNFVAVTRVGLGLARSSSRASRRAGALPQFFAKLERLKDGLKAAPDLNMAQRRRPATECRALRRPRSRRVGLRRRPGGLAGRRRGGAPAGVGVALRQRGAHHQLDLVEEHQRQHDEADLLAGQ